MHIKKRLEIERNQQRLKILPLFRFWALVLLCLTELSQLNQIYHHRTKGIFLPHSFCLQPKSSLISDFHLSLCLLSDSLQHFKTKIQGVSESLGGLLGRLIFAAHPSLGHKLSLTSLESGFAFLKR